MAGRYVRLRLPIGSGTRPVQPARLLDRRGCPAGGSPLSTVRPLPPANVGPGSADRGNLRPGHDRAGRCIYDHTEGMWYEWQGHAWERGECKHARLLASGPLASVYLDTSAQLSEEAAQAE